MLLFLSPLEKCLICRGGTAPWFSSSRTGEEGINKVTLLRCLFSVILGNIHFGMKMAVRGTWAAGQCQLTAVAQDWDHFPGTSPAAVPLSCTELFCFPQSPGRQGWNFPPGWPGGSQPFVSVPKDAVGLLATFLFPHSRTIHGGLLQPCPGHSHHLPVLGEQLLGLHPGLLAGAPRR